MKVSSYLHSILFLFVVSSLIGCMVQKAWIPTGGSKADATVRLAYEYKDFEIPQDNSSQALDLARERCRAWGFLDAQHFGGKHTTCNFQTVNGCESWLVTAEFQCL